MTVDSTNPGLRRAHERLTERALRVFFAEQAEELRPQVEQGFVAFEVDRWRRELAATMWVRGKDTAADYGRTVFSLLGRSLRFDPDLMDDWLDVWSEMSAENINDMIFENVEHTVMAEDPVEQFDEFYSGMVAVRAGLYAVSVTTTTGMFGAHDGARAAGARSKTWQVNSGNPRSEHLAVNGETVGLDETFSNNMRWPGDPSGGAEQVANCVCSLVFEEA